VLVVLVPLAKPNFKNPRPFRQFQHFEHPSIYSYRLHCHDAGDQTPGDRDRVSGREAVADAILAGINRIATPMRGVQGGVAAPRSEAEGDELRIPPGTPNAPEGRTM